MKRTSQSFTMITCLVLGLLSLNLFAQVGINTTTPADGSILDVDSSEKGVLVPRVNITDLSTIAPITGGSTEGLLVYNTNTTTGPGFVFWDGSSWVAIDGDNDWKKDGNAGTTPGTAANENYIGTSDAQDFIVATDGAERLRFLSNGQISANGTPLFAADRFTVLGVSGEFAVNGYSSDATGVYGENSSGTGNGVFGNSSNVGVRGFGGVGAILESGLDSGYGAVAWNTSGTGPNGIGLLSIGQNLTPLSLQGTGAVLYGDLSGAYGRTDSATGTGLIGRSGGASGIFTLTEGSGLAGSGLQYGVFGYATQSGVNAGDGTIGSAGGAFANGDGGQALVAVWADPSDGLDNDQNFKIIGTGAVSTIVKDVNEKPVIMFAPEAPETLFQDYGTGQLRGGRALIKLDPTFTKNILVDDSHPLRVFIQLEGDCNGVYVTNKTSYGFEVVELQNGSSNAAFSWSVVATRANEVFTDSNGQNRISHNDRRFPPAPERLQIKVIPEEKLDRRSLENLLYESKAVKKMD